MSVHHVISTNAAMSRSSDICRITLYAMDTVDRIKKEPAKTRYVSLAYLCKTWRHASPFILDEAAARVCDALHQEKHLKFYIIFPYSISLPSLSLSLLIYYTPALHYSPAPFALHVTHSRALGSYYHGIVAAPLSPSQATVSSLSFLLLSLRVQTPGPSRPARTRRIRP